MEIDDIIREAKRQGDKFMVWTDASPLKEFMDKTGFRVKQNDVMIDVNNINNSQPFTFMGLTHKIE